MDEIPDHIILDIYDILHKHKHNPNNNINNSGEGIVSLLSYQPNLATVSKRFYKLYCQNYTCGEKYMLFLCRMGVFPLFKMIYNKPSDVSNYFVNRLTLTNGSLSKYPLDHYLILRLKDNNSVSNILLDPHNHDDKYCLLDKLKDLINLFKNNEQRFFYDGLYHTYIDIYHTDFTIAI